MDYFQNIKVWARENDLNRDLKFNENDKVRKILKDENKIKKK